MRITYTSNAIIPSRTANSIHVMHMCAAYSDLGHTVDLLVPRWSGTEPVDDIYAYYGVPSSFDVRFLAAPAWNHYDLPFYSLYMAAHARRGMPDLIHTRSLPVAWGLTTLLRTPVLYETHQPDYAPGVQQRMYQHTVRSRRLRGIVVITRALRDLLPEQPARAPVIVAPDAVPAAALSTAQDRQTARALIGLTDTCRPIALYTGHLYPGRGIDLILDLAARLPETDFVIVGGRDSDIAGYAESASHLPNTRFVGFVPPAEVPSYLQAADVLLMPYADNVETTGGTDSARFASPMKMFEYMAAGRPIIASTLPVLQEVLCHNENAVLVPYDQPGQWRDAILSLLNDQDHADRLAAHARHDVEQYTWTRRAEHILSSIQTRTRTQAKVVRESSHPEVQ
jgi:glycosyltransferase involved in cell wall biosynthesis